MSLASLYQAEETVSPAKADSKSVVSGTGTYISSIPSTYEVPIARILDDSGGFSRDQIVYRSADLTQWLDFMPTHLHNTSQASSGGKLLDIEGANSALLMRIKLHRANDYYIDKTSGASVVDNFTAGSLLNVKFDTGSVANDYANGLGEGVKADWTQMMYFSTKLQLSHNVDILWRHGVGMERAQSTSDNSKKIGLEGCAGDGTNIQIVSSDGITRTKTSSGSNMAQGQARGYRLVYTPATSLVYTDSLGGAITKSTNIPSNGATLDYPVVSGVKTTNTTPKQMYIWMTKLMAGIGDPDFA